MKAREVTGSWHSFQTKGPALGALAPLLSSVVLCSFYPQQGGTKDRGSPAFRQKKRAVAFHS